MGIPEQRAELQPFAERSVFNLATLPDTQNGERGFRTSGLATIPRFWKEAEINAIRGYLQQIIAAATERNKNKRQLDVSGKGHEDSRTEKQIEQDRILENLEEDPLYRSFVLKRIESPTATGDPIQSDSPLLTAPNILPALPYHSDVQQVIDVFRVAAQAITEHIAIDLEKDDPQIVKAQNNIVKAICSALDQNIRNCDGHQQIRKDIYTHQPLEDREFFSTKELREAVKEIGQLIRIPDKPEHIIPTEASLELGLRLGILDPTQLGLTEGQPINEMPDMLPPLQEGEIDGYPKERQQNEEFHKRKAEIIQDLEICHKKAISLYTKVWSGIRDAQKTFLSEDRQEAEMAEHEAQMMEAQAQKLEMALELKRLLDNGVEINPALLEQYPQVKSITKEDVEGIRIIAQTARAGASEAAENLEELTEIVEINIRDENQTTDLFGLLDKVITQWKKDKATTDVEKRESLKAYNEAQTIAYLTYLIYQTRKHPHYVSAKSNTKAMHHAIITALFPEKQGQIEEGRIYRDPRGNIVRGETDDIVPRDAASYEEQAFRQLRLPGWIAKMGDQRVLLRESFRPKQMESIIKKLLINPDKTIEELPDMIAGKIVMWDVEYARDLQEDSPRRDEHREYLKAIAHKVGTSMGLKPASCHRDALEPGYFTIDEKKLLKGSTDNDKSLNFHALKLYGLTTEGARVEYQIIPRDIWEQVNSEHSPNHHDLYDLMRLIKVGRILFRSSHPHLHKVMDKLEERLKRIKMDYSVEYRQNLEANQNT
jgi:hypothetical protein